MKRAFNCFDVVVGKVVNRVDANVDEKKELFLIEQCEVIDKFISEFEIKTIEAHVDKETKDIIITLVCSEFEMNSEHFWFYELLSQTVALHMRICDDELFEFEFIYDGIWEEADE